MALITQRGPVAFAEAPASRAVRPASPIAAPA